tara:strand:+ start:1452 stop:1634 length:183 start_codon:yes stop_codon:yes gene_type:complete
VQVGDLVQLRPHYKNRDRWAVITRNEEWSGYCQIIFMDTQERTEAVKSALIMFDTQKEIK